MGEEVGEGEIASVAEAIDDEASFGNELGEREIGGDRRERGEGE